MHGPMNNTPALLNDLIEILKDGQEGFRASATESQSSQLKTTLSEYSLQRSKFAGELQSLAHSLGEKDPANSGSVSGALHRGWIGLKTALASRNDHAILAECERGEDVAVAAYRKALETATLPADIRATLQTQLAAIEAAHNRVRSLRDASAPK